jgi:predicted DNA repair protein MutK
MSVGLLGLLDDVTALAKVAAASIDDVAGQAAKAGLKAAGAVIDDAAVTPNYVTGFKADRELPIVWKIAVGSIRNKLLFLLPAAIALSLFVPWLITPLLMIGGAYLCYEGAEKVFEALFPHAAHEHEHEAEAPEHPDPSKLEEERVAGAIQTDFILSAEIMTIALAALPGLPLWETIVILIVVAFGITAAVYGAVALIVKADDIGLALATKGRTGAGRALGRGILVAMPWVMQTLSVVGTAAMIWVGGGIVAHGLAGFGLGFIEHGIEAFAHWAEELVPQIGGFLGELATIAADLVLGLVLGLVLIPIVGKVIAPAWRAIRGLFKRDAAPGH